MEYRPAPGRRYYCFPTSNNVEGPFELVELAGLLRAGHITADTPVVPEGEEQWMPFQERPEFNLALEIPQSAVHQHVAEKASTQGSAFTPRRLAVFAWFMMVPLLYIAYRFAMMYLRYHFMHGAAAPDSLGSPDGQ